MKKLGYILFLSTIAAIGGFLFGYDTAVISGTIDQVASQFGLDAIQTGWYVGCALVGSIAGVVVAGVVSDRFGRKRSLLLAALLFSISAIGCALCVGFVDLVAYRIVGGVGIGIASIVSPLYISEVAMARYRGSLVSMYQVAITVGFLGAYLVNYQLLSISQSVAFDNAVIQKLFAAEVWRGMLGMESLPAVFFFVLIFFIPESPRWLILNGNITSALTILTRINKDKDLAAGEVELVKHAISGEQGSLWQVLSSSGVRKAVWIGAAIAMLGQFMGVNAVLYYGPTIFAESGLSAGDSLFYQVIVGLVNVVTAILALFIIDRVGRKKLVYFGVSGMILMLVAISWYFGYGIEMGVSSNYMLIFFLSYIFFCAISICAVIFVLLSEMYPMKVRGVAMSIAGLSLWIGTYLIGQLTPWFFETIRPAGTFILFAIMCVPYILIIALLVPETSGKSLEQIEEYWK